MSNEVFCRKLLGLYRAYIKDMVEANKNLPQFEDPHEPNLNDFMNWIVIKFEI